MNSLSQLETSPSLRSGQTSGHKIHKDTLKLNNTISQLDVTDTYMLLHPTTAEFILLKLIQNISQNRTLNRSYKACYQTTNELN